MEKRATIKDVAKEAGVSISTVSNALNNVNVLNPDTKERVLEVARRLNYTPNLNGRNLKAQATGVLGLSVVKSEDPTMASFQIPFTEPAENHPTSLRFS